MTDKRKEAFLYAWENDLDDAKKVAIFNAYANEHNPDEALWSFDEDFFNMFFEGDPMAAVRACFFGNIRNWSDEYIKFNGYGNLVSLSEWDAAHEADDYVDEIYEHEDCWVDEIDLSDYLEEDEESDGDDEEE